MSVLDDIGRERLRQNAKWGEQNYPDGTGDSEHVLLGLGKIVNYSLTEVTAGTLAYLAKHSTDYRAADGYVSWADILLEEVFEALAEDDVARVRTELIQVAAVATQWVEAIDRRDA